MNCWRYANLDQTVLSCAQSVDGFVEFIHKALATWSEVDAGKMTMALWSIWRQRNCKLLNSKLQAASQTVFLALEFLCDWLAAQDRKRLVSFVHRSNGVGETLGSWEKPPTAVLKCNIDVAIFADLGAMRHGMILRDDKGEFVLAKSMMSDGIYAVKEGEAIGLFHAIRWVIDLGYDRVIFELDSKLVVDAINSTLMDVSEFWFSGFGS
ncbi:hypothetical protein PTKIN_Ptkin03bG0084800 [Pterospermum kingtungense]